MGAGALGSLYGGLLSNAGHEVVLVGREPHVHAVMRDGLLVRSQTDITVRVHAVTSTDQVKGPFHLILLTVKAYDTRQAARLVTHLMDDTTALICLQNGLGPAIDASEIVNHPIRGVTSHGALMIQPGVIAHTGIGDTVLGELTNRLTPRVQTFAAMFNATGIPTAPTTNIQGVVWTKTLVNCGINPFGALTGLTNGALVRAPALKALMCQTVEEGLAVASKLDVTLEDDPVERMLTIAEATANNKNSMLQDMLQNRRTEIDYLNGAVARMGKKVHVPVVLNEVLTNLVKAFEQQRIKQQ
jgi:2-dehydropantoate 2-reductase